MLISICWGYYLISKYYYEDRNIKCFQDRNCLHLETDYKEKKNPIKRLNLCYANISTHMLMFILAGTALACKHCMLVMGQHKNIYGFVLN